MEGSYAVFGVTNYWEYIDGERETRQGKNLADAAKVSIGPRLLLLLNVPLVSRF